jgi:hypothetical protein
MMTWIVKMPDTNVLIVIYWRLTGRMGMCSAGWKRVRIPYVSCWGNRNGKSRSSL